MVVNDAEYTRSLKDYSFREFFRFGGKSKKGIKKSVAIVVYAITAYGRECAFPQEEPPPSSNELIAMLGDKRPLASRNSRAVRTRSEGVYILLCVKA